MSSKVKAAGKTYLVDLSDSSDNESDSEIEVLYVPEEKRGVFKRREERRLEDMKRKPEKAHLIGNEDNDSGKFKLADIAHLRTRGSSGKPPRNKERPVNFDEGKVSQGSFNLRALVSSTPIILEIESLCFSLVPLNSKALRQLSSKYDDAKTLFDDDFNTGTTLYEIFDKIRTTFEKLRKPFSSDDVLLLRFVEFELTLMESSVYSHELTLLDVVDTFLAFRKSIGDNVPCCLHLKLSHEPSFISQFEKLQNLKPMTTRSRKLDLITADDAHVIEIDDDCEDESSSESNAEIEEKKFEEETNSNIEVVTNGESVEEKHFDLREESSDFKKGISIEGSDNVAADGLDENKESGHEFEKDLHEDDADRAQQSDSLCSSRYHDTMTSFDATSTNITEAVPNAVSQSLLLDVTKEDELKEQNEKQNQEKSTATVSQCSEVSVAKVADHRACLNEAEEGNEREARILPIQKLTETDQQFSKRPLDADSSIIDQTEEPDPKRANLSRPPEPVG